MIRPITGVKEEDKERAIEEIKNLLNHTDSIRMHNRYQTIFLLLKGYKPEMVADIINLSLPSIYEYARIYREEGMIALNLDKYKGAKAKLTPDQEDVLKETIINKKPVDVGLPAEMNWTSPLIRKFIAQEFNVSYSSAGVKDLLARLNFSYTRPTYVLTKADPEKQTKFKEEFEEIKKN